MWKGRNQQVKNLFCKRICKPDTAGQGESVETPKARGDFPPRVCQGQRGDWRLPETTETGVVWLITQRSQVQILPPLPSCRSEASSDHGRGLLHASCKRICNGILVRPLAHVQAVTDDQLGKRDRELPVALQSAWAYCFIANATSAWPTRWLSAFQSIFASRPALV
jgi:hypothetical protein